MFGERMHPLPYTIIIHYEAGQCDAKARLNMLYMDDDIAKKKWKEELARIESGDLPKKEAYLKGKIKEAFLIDFRGEKIDKFP